MLILSHRMQDNIHVPYNVHVTMIVYTFVIPRLDYCNILLCGFSKKNINVQDYAVHLIMRFGKNERMTLMLCYFNSLPIELLV